MEKIEVRAAVTSVEHVYPEKKYHAVTLDCGQPFSKVLSISSWTGYQPFVIDKSRSQPEKGLLVLKIHGEPDLREGDHVHLEIEPAP